MKQITNILLFLIAISTNAQYAPNADEQSTTAISKDSSIINAWATNYTNYIIGLEVDTAWQHPEKALGKAEGMSGEVVSLGRGGEITFTFSDTIFNVEGTDFATFENALNNTFLELAWVEVSQDGINFTRFPNYSLTQSSVGAYDGIDATKITGYCSKYRQGFGTPFDLEDVDLDYIKYVKIIDIIGDGTALDSDGNIIYDPYPTTGSAGVDIDAIAVINQQKTDGVSNVSIKSDISIYPNPVINSVQLLVGNEQLNKAVQILTTDGKVVKQFNISDLHTTINIVDLKKGMYFIKIENRIYKIIKI